MKSEIAFGVVPLRKHSGVWEVLIVKHISGNHWGFPKGKKEDGESGKETALRELKEETGLSVKKFVSQAEITEHYNFFKLGEKVKKSVTYFVGEIIDETLIPQQKELLDIKWVPLFEATSHLTYPEAKNVCLQTISLLEVFNHE